MRLWHGLLASLWTTLRQLRRRDTLEYPEQQPKLGERWRGRPILTRDPDGEERCVACELCSAVCPTHCIALEGADRPNGRRFAQSFRINFARCIYCGLCEEACPTVAIQLSSEFAFAKTERGDFVYHKEALLIDGTGKHPEYRYYDHAGVRTQALPEPRNCDPRSNLP
ncbi:NADH-quinone oxidoreductase subunit NuoI [Acidithiobacillus sp. AC3]